jgi:hypothetical protein
LIDPLNLYSAQCRPFAVSQKQQQQQQQQALRLIIRDLICSGTFLILSKSRTVSSTPAPVNTIIFTLD